MVKVRPYGKGSGWEVEFVHPSTGRRTRRKAAADDQAGAHRWGEALFERLTRQAELRRKGGHTKKKRSRGASPTLEQFVGSRDGSSGLNTFFGYHRAQKTEDSTLRAYWSLCNNWILPLLGDLQVDEIEVTHLEQLKSEMCDLSRKTVNNALGVALGMLRVARRLGVLDADKLPEVKWLKVGQQPIVYYGDEAYERLVAAALVMKDLRVPAIVLLGGDASLRIGESAAVFGTALQCDGQLLVKRSRDFAKKRDKSTKNRSHRYMPLTKRLREVLEALKKVRGPGRLIVELESGRPLRYLEMVELLRRAQHAAGVDLHGSHALRHTFGTRAMRAGVPPRVLMELGGWSSLAMVERYTHVNDSMKVDAIRRLQGATG